MAPNKPNGFYFYMLDQKQTRPGWKSKGLAELSQLCREVQSSSGNASVADPDPGTRPQCESSFKNVNKKYFFGFGVMEPVRKVLIMGLPKY